MRICHAVFQQNGSGNILNRRGVRINAAYIPIHRHIDGPHAVCVVIYPGRNVPRQRGRKLFLCDADFLIAHGVWIVRAENNGMLCRSGRRHHRKGGAFCGILVFTVPRIDRDAVRSVWLKPAKHGGSVFGFQGPYRAVAGKVANLIRGLFTLVGVNLPLQRNTVGAEGGDTEIDRRFRCVSFGITP